MTGPVRVVGIDPSLTKTGVGVIEVGPAGAVARGVQLAHRRPLEARKRAKAGLPTTATLAERDECLRALVDDVLDVVADPVAFPALVVVYDPPAGVKLAGAARIDVPAAWSLLVGALLAAGVPVARVMDVAARKALVGSRPRGESRESAKLATGLAVAKLYPDTEIASDDVADALAAAHLGAVALALDVPTLARHRDVRWSEWPAGLAVPAADGALAAG